MTTMHLPSGERVEYDVVEHPHRFWPITNAVQTWLGDVTLTDVVELWWKAQAYRAEREEHQRRLDCEREANRAKAY